MPPTSSHSTHLPALRPHIGLSPRVDAGVPEQGLQDGQVALLSRQVKRGVAILQGKEGGGGRSEDLLVY